MLGGLKLATDPRWVDLTNKSIEFILTDHAFCEQKAATNCISLIQKFSEYQDVVDSLVPIVSEEWGHFKMVLEKLKQRGMTLGKQRKDEYVNKLIHFSKGGFDRDHQLVERLLVSAMIEARSCERFRLLSVNMEDEDLKLFYKKLMISEAGHFRLFLDLALKYKPKAYVMKRWEEYLEFEAAMLQTLELRGDRVH